MNSCSPEIYEQLAWLVRGDLPLPDAIAQLAKDARSPKTKRTFGKLALKVQSGETLAAAMRQQPEDFRALYVNLVKAGEANGFLAEMLQEVSKLARFEQSLGHRLRERLAYPCMTLIFGIMVAAGFLTWVAPGFDAMFQEYAIGKQLPLLTDWMIVLSRAFSHHELWVVTGILLMIVFSLWLFSKSGARTFDALAGSLPGTHYLWRLLDYSRLSAVLAIAVRHNLSLTDALATATTMVQSKKLRRLLTDWTQRSRDGETLTDMLVQAREVDQLFALALKHAPEEELSTVCTNLAEMYHEQAEIYLDRFIMATSAVLITVVGIVIGLLILSLFTPFIQIVNTLAID